MAELKQLRFRFCFYIWQRSLVETGLGSFCRHRPLCSLWWRHWFRGRVLSFASFVFQPKQCSGTTTGAGGHQTLSAVLRVWDIWLADNILLSHSRWSLCSLLWRHGVWSYKHFAIVVKKTMMESNMLNWSTCVFLVLLSKYDYLWLRLDRVQFEMGDDRHHPLCSLWLRHWFRRRVFIFISFFPA